jgi:protein-tyrosine-phosphatase/DNA-binding transcriptional ArsR family regulator
MPDILRLLAHDLRWSLLQCLMTGDYQVHELVALLQQPMNLVSYHLKQMRDASLVSARRSDADGRDVYYSVELDTLRQAYLAAGSALHPALITMDESPSLHPTALPRTRVLVVCTHNSARSQMAEGLLRARGGGQIEVYSAGSHPTRLHPEAVRVMDAAGIDIRGQHSKSLSEFEGQAFDYVITVCDQAREICPTFPGGAVYTHWGFADPTAHEDRTARAHAFEQTAKRLAGRVDYFLARLQP